MSYNDTKMSDHCSEFDSIKTISSSIPRPATYLMSIRDVFCHEFHATLIILSSELSDRLKCLLRVSVTT